MEFTFDDKTWKVFSFDGGGIRGIFQASFLSCVKKTFPLLLKDACLFTGTSTGAIIAVGLALQKTPEELVELYQGLGPQLFGKKANLIKRYAMGYPAYSSERLKQTLKEHLGECAFRECRPRTLVTAVSLVDYSLKIFDSEDPADGSENVVDILMASTAAPSFFEPYCFSSDSGDKFFLDGGLACNNPSYETLRFVEKMVAAKSSIRLMSIGTSKQPVANDPDRFKRKTRIGWAKPVIAACFEVNAALVDREVAKRIADGVDEDIAKKNYLRIDPPSTKQIELDDFKKSLNILPSLASAEANKRKEEIKSWLAE